MYYRYWEHDDPIHSAPAHYGIRSESYKLIYYYGAGSAYLARRPLCSSLSGNSTI